jgi:Kef-type K+ transport system membrane component KefB/nucleotide-binding universal stress UspA family protein
MAAEHTIAQFLAQVILLLLVGRLLGEFLNRLGQPSIFGQLLGGVVLGPSVFGALAPELYGLVFPPNPALKSMIDGLAQVGILMLLLLTGMETNLALVNRRRRAVAASSLSGILVPFACGFATAYVLPAGIVPAPETRLVTALFLGTALSISSVKIVAMVLMEVGATRRDLGQLILATAILDDLIAWIIFAVIAGIATHGGVDLLATSGGLIAVAAFLAVSLTAGRRFVARIIRWTNDTMSIEVPVVTSILVVTLGMALITSLIGVHTALGAFVAGILVGQSPILTDHIEGELRGLIMAFFSPIFFGIAGLGIDVRSLWDPQIIAFTLAIIAVATLGKFGGALAGGKIGGLRLRESLALATGLNARGSTEVIIASFGLGLGVLSTQLYTIIVLMAVVTTMVMPPALRFALARVPLRHDEARRLEKEQAEESQSLPKMQRALAYVDASPNGLVAARIAGAFAAGQSSAVTVLELPSGAADARGTPGEELMRTARRIDARASADDADERLPIEELVHSGDPTNNAAAVEQKLAKGYDLVIAGLERPILADQHRFAAPLQKLVNAATGPVAIALNARAGGLALESRPRFLVPTGGTPQARFAMELGVLLAKATGGAVTVLHVFEGQSHTELLRGRARRLGLSVLADARRLASQSGVAIETLTAVHAKPEIAIRRTAHATPYDLVLVGAALRLGENKLLGLRTAALLETLKTPLLLVVQ